MFIAVTPCGLSVVLCGSVTPESSSACKYSPSKLQNYYLKITNMTQESPSEMEIKTILTVITQRGVQICNPNITYINFSNIHTIFPLRLTFCYSPKLRYIRLLTIILILFLLTFSILSFAAKLVLTFCSCPYLCSISLIEFCVNFLLI